MLCSFLYYVTYQIFIDYAFIKARVLFYELAFIDKPLYKKLLLVVIMHFYYYIISVNLRIFISCAKCLNRTSKIISSSSWMMLSEF